MICDLGYIGGLALVGSRLIAVNRNRRSCALVFVVASLLSLARSTRDPPCEQWLADVGVDARLSFVSYALAWAVVLWSVAGGVGRLQR
jgi:hypothetical protein